MRGVSRLAFWMFPIVGLVPLGVSSVSPAEISGTSLSGIPAFARLYRTGCTTCHVAAPKLNVLGEAFRLNAYRFPENDALLRDQEEIPLGARGWEDLWPRAIRPGGLPSSPPVSLRVVSDVQYTADEKEPFEWTYRFPEEIHLAAAAALGDGVAVFAELEWEEEGGAGIEEAKVAIQDPFSFIPERGLTLWIGKQKLYLLTFGENRIDRAGRVPFLWGMFDPSSVVLRRRSERRTVRSENDLQLQSSQPAIGVQGIVSRRTFYSLGLSQGTTDLGSDDNGAKDFYYTIRHKLGGLALDGTYDQAQASMGRGGQLYDHSLTLEHFGYWGTSPVSGGVEDDYRSFGLAARWMAGPLDLGAGYVWGKNDDPWGEASRLGLKHWSAFTRAEFLLYPWLLGSLKAETLRTSIEGDRAARDQSRIASDQARLVPGIVALLRQNVRAVVEAELYTRHEGSRESGLDRPHNLWFRLDVSF